MVQENDTKLCDLAIEVDGLVKIFVKYQDGSIPRSMYDRLHMITECVSILFHQNECLNHLLENW